MKSTKATAAKSTKTAKKAPAAKKAANKKPTAKQIEAALVDQGDKPAKKAPATKAAKTAAKVEPPHKLPRLSKDQKSQLEAQKNEALQTGDITSTGSPDGTVKDGVGAIPIVRKSVVTNPVHAAWDIFDNLLAKSKQPGGAPLRRKDAIAYAVDHGVAFYTARTQYQSWKVANKL